jgi:hypothetical protein
VAEAVFLVAATSLAVTLAVILPVLTRRQLFTAAVFAQRRLSTVAADAVAAEVSAD